MNNWKVKHPRTDLSFEIAFTKAYREAKAKFTHPAQIELAALRAQFPAIMHEIEDEDLFAGTRLVASATTPILRGSPICWPTSPVTRNTGRISTIC